MDLKEPGPMTNECLYVSKTLLTNKQIEVFHPESHGTRKQKIKEKKADP